MFDINSVNIFFFKMWTELENHDTLDVPGRFIFARRKEKWRSLSQSKKSEKKNTLEEKSFQTPLTFYSIPIFDIKYLQDNLLCVPIMLVASEAHNQKEMHLLFLVNETK